ncbi:MAG: UDP-3-O-(3-hydroxymyristoyl)glucosamine N-acyltransferase [Fimbriimonadales bacterium]|nr:UDP-3-O-(3-hydroxymyristoyl)glucosamine N-acyltransferase [Fimbriimonadales bacterium]MDW8051826.1 UDP-3-O-(3-hydroxymyristoyl)glucosamine N-acyltransferase [Armatimonadota bacterium]
MASYRLVQLAELTQGIVRGNAELVITAVGGIHDVPAGGLTFAENERRLQEALRSPASAILTAPNVSLPSDTDKSFLLHPVPRLAWAKILALYSPFATPPVGIHPTVVMGEGCELGDEVSLMPYVVLGERVRLGNRVKVYPFCYIGDEVEIGDDTVLYPHVVVMARVRIGKRVIVHPGAVIGGDGYGYVQHAGIHHKIPQIGRVVVEDDVEIGCNTTIDRATTGETRIGPGTKIDNLVQVAHNVQVGAHCLLVAQVGIAGSATLGHHVILAGQVGVKDHVHIGDNVVVGAQGGVAKNLPPNGVYWGTPAVPHHEWLRALAHLYKLPELFKRVEALERRLRERD